MKKTLLKAHHAFVCAILLTFNITAQELGYTNAFPSLTFDTPLEIIPSNDGSNRLFVVEKPGYIYEVSEATGVKSLVVDLSSIVSSGKDGTEIGLLGMALHPNFQNNRLFYIYYISGAPPYKVNLAQLTLNSGNPSATANSRKIVFTATKPTTHHTHNGGHIEFGPDGYLYMGIGDGGDSTGNGNQRAQDLSHIFGSILRIAVNTNGTYSIPSSNPYASSGDTDTRKIWIYGLRNPWKFSFHGDEIWIGDVGAGQQDEINRVKLSYGGSNYGWGRWEGTYRDQSVSLNGGGTLRPPYFSKSATSLTGGYVYKGSLSNPEIQGKYVFADYISGDIWAIDPTIGPDSTDPTRATNTQNLAQSKLFTTSPDDAAIVSFGQNESGTELYFLRYGQNYDGNPNSSNAYNFEDNSGAIFKITGTQSTSTVAVNGIGNFDQCPNDLNGQVNAIEKVGNTIWLGGSFTNAEGTTAYNLVKYDENTGFSATYAVNGEVEDIHVAPNGDIWVGGNFGSINGATAKNLAQISNGSIINHNSTGVIFEIDSAPNGYVYIVGATTSVSGVSVSKFARYRGSSWDNMNTYPNNELRAIEVLPNGDVFVGGNFTAIGSVNANRIAKFDGSKWAAYPGTNSLFIKEIEEFNGYLYVGGQNYMGRYILSNDTHQILSKNVAGGEVRSITSDGSYIYIGGTFGTVSNDGSTNLIMNGLARWSPYTNTYDALGPGTNVGTDNSVSDLLHSNGELYVGGEFTNIGNYFARWSMDSMQCPSTSSCVSDIPNENTSFNLSTRLLSGNITNSGTSAETNNSACAMQLSGGSGQPWARYVIPIDLAARGISAGQQITISIDGKTGSGNAQMQVARNNAPNSSILTKSFGSSWQTQSGTITVPSGVSTLDIWLFPNFGNSSSAGSAFFDNLNVSVTGGSGGSCTSDLANENGALPLNDRDTAAGSVSKWASTVYTNNSPCAMGLSGPAGQPWARYVIPIDLAARGISAGQQITISIDGMTGSGNAQMQIARNNAPNSSILTKSFGSSWQTQSGTITVPSGVSTLDIWLFPNFGNSSSAGSAFFDNLNVSVTGGSGGSCTSDLPNENGAMPLNDRDTAAGNVAKWATTVYTNNSPCAMGLNSEAAGQPWARYVIPIDLAARGISAGQQITISIDGKTGSGNAQMQIARNNAPNSSILTRSFGTDWQTQSGTITVPSGVSTLDIWLFPNFGDASGPGSAFFDNLNISVTGESGVSCISDLANENGAMPLNDRDTAAGNVAKWATTVYTNNSPCAMGLNSEAAGQPWARYVIPIDLAARGISAGQQITISIDGKTGSGNAQMQVARNNAPNSSILTRSFGTDWQTQSGTITVPSGVSTLDIWLFPNFGDASRPGNAFFDNLNISVNQSSSLKTNLDIGTVSVFPNPGIDKIQVSLPKYTHFSTYTMYNLNGAVVKKGIIEPSESTIEITVYDIAKGLYMLNLSNSSGDSTYIKVLKE